MTHSGIVADLSDQLSFHINRKKPSFIKKCLYTTKSIINIISNIVMFAHMSTAGKS